ncbi:MAG: glycosyltransferase family 2 protein [Panacagrimonas sp.]
MMASTKPSSISPAASVPTAADPRPRVSVVIPTHNRLEMMQRALASALAQTVTDIEVIVVDDGSSDGTAAWLAAQTEPRLRFMRHDPARRAPAARNAGTLLAAGEWIAYLDDDDVWYPHKLERQLALTENAIGVISSFRFAGSGGGHRILRGRRLGPEHLRKGSPCGCSGIMVRADIARAVPYDESLRISQDWDLLMRLLDRGTVNLCPEILYEMHTGSWDRITTAARGRSIDERERLAAATLKHRARLGDYWFRYRMSREMTTYLSADPKRWSRLGAVLRRHGVLPVAHVFLDRLLARFG